MLTVLEEHQNKENRKRGEGADSNAKINHIYITGTDEVNMGLFLATQKLGILFFF